MKNRLGSMRMTRVMGLIVLGAALGMTMAAAKDQTSKIQPAKRIAATFEGGYETDRRDRGRPVVLIAGALGVKTEVFREAFSHVRPARDGAPTPERAQTNKAALLGALAQYGVTNERLDEVSDHYRYRPERGERWPTRAAKAFAIVEKGKIVRFEIVDGGEGYSSVPRVSVPGFPSLKATPILGFDKAFERNGSIRSIQTG